jgi:hypothetical protein
MAPPPAAITQRSAVASSPTSMSASISRKAASPSRSKISGIGPKRLLDLPVVVVEPPAEAPRDLLGDARLARAHEAYERDRPV